MKHPFVIAAQFAGLIAAMVLSAGAVPVAAAAADGVRCPNGYEAQFDSGQKVLRCERNTTQHRPTVCDPLAPAYLVYRVAKGRDICVRPEDAAAPLVVLADNEGKRRHAVCSSDGDGLRWQIEIDASGERDRCRATRSEWIYPSQQ